MNRQSAAWIPVMLFLLLVLSGCPDTLGPFNPTVIDQIKDKNPPVITIITPEAYDAYTQTVTVTGRVTDDGESLPILTYTVTDESGLGKKAGDVTVTEGTAGTGVAGSFSFSFTTVEYSTDIILSVTATDWNGNAGDPTTLRLVYPGSTLSSFSLTPGNKQVSLSWEPISGADEYTVYYNSGGTAFNEATADSFTIAAGAYDGSDPVVLTAADHGVKNGVLCRVKVKASSAGGDQWSSSVLETLPLSQFSLLPKTDCFENKIVLYWRPASDGVTYQVWRSETGKEGPYELISGTSLTEPRFTDTQVQEGQRYHYRVGAEENSAQLSAPADASTTSMKTSGSAEIYRALKTDSIIALAVSGTTAYGVTYDIMTDSIEVISLDISLPSSPLELDRTTWNVPPGASLMSVYDIAVSEDAAFVSLWYSNPSSVYEVVAFDIGEPENLAEIGDAFIDCGDRALDLKVDGTRDLLYIAMDSDGLACVDISKPADQWTPVVASGWSGGNAWGVAFSGNYAYAANLGYGVTVGNFTSKTAPTIGSTVAPGSVPGADVYKAIDADPTENLLVMVSEHDDPDSAYYHGGVWALDITTPSVPVVKDSIDLGIPLTDVKLDGSYAFCSTGNGGVRMVDCNNPTELFERISYDTVGDSYKLDFFASGIAVGDGGGGVAVILPPDIENPTIIDDDINDLSQTNGSFLQEDILYIAARYCLYSLQVESDGTVSDLAVNADADSGDVVVLGDYAFVAVGEGGSPRLGVIDVADPGDLSNALFVECEKGPNSIDYWGDYLYLGEGDAGVQVFDIADPEQPVSLGLIPVNRSARMVAAFKDRLFIADYAYGLLAYDIRDPENPVFINDFYDISSSERQVYSIDVSEDHVYACMEDYIHILSTDTIGQWESAETGASDFGSAVGWIDFPSYCTNIRAEGDFLYANTFATSLEIYSIQNPEHPAKLYDSGPGFFTANHQSLEIQGNRLFCNNYSTLYSVRIMEE